MKTILTMLFVTVVAVVGSLLLGCEAETEPYVRTHVVGDYQLNWFSDGPDLAITVTNPTPFKVGVEIACVGAPEVWEVTLAPKGHPGDFASGFGRVMNKDALFTPCWRKSWRVLP